MQEFWLGGGDEIFTASLKNYIAVVFVFFWSIFSLLGGSSGGRARSDLGDRTLGGGGGEIRPWGSDLGGGGGGGGTSPLSSPSSWLN